jgi:hypothetical protein
MRRISGESRLATERLQSSITSATADRDRPTTYGY